MKRKIFSALAVVLFMSSSLNAKSDMTFFSTNPYTCWDAADETVAAFQTALLKMKKIATYEQEYAVWEQAYDSCMGN